jgi:hypothetical protein
MKYSRKMKKIILITLLIMAKINTPFAPGTPDQTTFYTPGEKGYTDYPFMNNN